MIEAADELVSLTQRGLVLGFIVFLRVGAAMALLPAFGEQSVSVRFRLAAALCLAALVAPIVAGTVPLPSSGSAFLPYLASEIVAGLAIGIAFRLYVVALQVAGSIAAQATSLSQLLGNGVAEPQPALGHLLVLGGLALAVSADLHVAIVETLAASYEVFPPGYIIGSEILLDWGVQRISGAFRLGFALAMPFLLASLIYNAALGVINRAMPQLMVALVGAPALTLGGLAMMALAVPYMLQIWIAAVERFYSAPFGPMQ